MTGPELQARFDAEGKVFEAVSNVPERAPSYLRRHGFLEPEFLLLMAYFLILGAATFVVGFYPEILLS